MGLWSRPFRRTRTCTWEPVEQPAAHIADLGSDDPHHTNELMQREIPIMTPASERQPASDTTSPPARPWIVRWRRRVPWIVGGLCLILILRMDFVISRLQRQVTHYQIDQQRTRTMAANLLWGQMSDVTHSLERAQAAAARNDSPATTTYLGDAQQHAYVADHTASLYQTILIGDQPGKGFGLADTILVLYGNAAANLSSRIGGHETLSSQDRTLLTALQADMTLLQMSFPEDLLANAPYERIDQAMDSFCQRRQVPSALELLNGTDGTLLTVCRSR
jgi:hypothetical protein